jgi:RHS repeat-associated protein
VSRAAHMGAIQAVGFTERQACFLVLVLEHWGVCLARPYRASAGIAHGRHTHRFFDKLIRAVLPRPTWRRPRTRGASTTSIRSRPAPAVVGGGIRRHMAARLIRILVALGLLLGAALPSAAAAVVRLTTSQQSAASVVPDRGADPPYASSYFGARYYDSTAGRFTTIDPVCTWKENLVDPQRWNRYAYVRNNPLRWIDPDGRETNPVTAATGINDAEIRREGYNARIGFYEAPRPANDPPVHRGVDIAAPVGTPLFAPISGTVSAGEDLYGGHWVRITKQEDGKKVEVHMSHLNGPPSVEAGSTVSEGQPGIAQWGNSGKSARGTSPHVHLSVWVNGERQDPQKWFADPRHKSVNAAVKPPQ